MPPLTLYSLPRNNVKLAIKFVEEQWGKLRPEDFAILAKLQDNPTRLFDALAKLEQRMQREKRGKPTKTAEVDQLGELIHYRDVPYCAVRDQLDTGAVIVVHAGTYYCVVTAQQVLTKWVRVIRVRDGKIIQVKREIALAKPHKYKPLKPLAPGQPEPPKPGEPPKPTPKPGTPPTIPPSQKWVRVLRLHDGKVVQVRREVALAKPHKYQLLTSQGTGQPVPPKPEPKQPGEPKKEAPPVPPKPGTAAPLPVPTWLAYRITDTGREFWQQLEQHPTLRQFIEAAADRKATGLYDKRIRHALAALALHHQDTTGEFAKLARGWTPRLLAGLAKHSAVNKLRLKLHEETGTDPHKRAVRKDLPPIHESLAQLKQAFNVGWLPDKVDDVSDLRQSDRLRETQPPRKAQQQIRASLSNILAHAGMYNHMGQKAHSTRYLVARQLTGSGAHFQVNGVHTWSGAILVREDVHHGAARFFDNPQHASESDVNHARTLIHEEIHGHTPMYANAYRGVGAFVEEATTEIAARHVMATAFGRKPGGGSYQREINKLHDAAESTLRAHFPGVPRSSYDEITGILQQASLKMREQQAWLPSWPEDFSRYFAETLSQVVPTTYYPQAGAEATPARREKLRQKFVKALQQELKSSRYELHKD